MEKQGYWKEDATKNLKKLYRKIKRCLEGELTLPCRFWRFGQKIWHRYDIGTNFPCQHLTKKQEKDAFEAFSKKVESKPSGITIESRPESLRDDTIRIPASMVTVEQSHDS